MERHRVDVSKRGVPGWLDLNRQSNSSPNTSQKTIALIACGNSPPGCFGWCLLVVAVAAAGLLLFFACWLLKTVALAGCCLLAVAELLLLSFGLSLTTQKW
eukprot:5353071-Amphidinium_carterae.1